MTRVVLPRNNSHKACYMLISPAPLTEIPTPPIRVKWDLIFRLFAFFIFLSTRPALTVRYLTRRFIGEYRSNTDLLYKQTVTLDSGVLDVEIVDISAENENDFPVEQIQWADACLIVYSITNRASYEYAQRSLAELRQLQNSPSAYLIGNKADLDHLREVSCRRLLLLAAIKRLVD